MVYNLGRQLKLLDIIKWSARKHSHQLSIARHTVLLLTSLKHHRGLLIKSTTISRIWRLITCPYHYGIRQWTLINQLILSKKFWKHTSQIYILELKIAHMYRRLTSTMPHRNDGKTGCYIDIPLRCEVTERRLCFVTVENGEFTTVTLTQGTDMGRVVLHLFRNLNAYVRVLSTKYMWDVNSNLHIRYVCNPINSVPYVQVRLWRFKSFVMLRAVKWQIVNDVTKDCNASIFRTKHASSAWLPSCAKSE